MLQWQSSEKKYLKKMSDQIVPFFFLFLQRCWVLIGVKLVYDTYLSLLCFTLCSALLCLITSVTNPRCILCKTFLRIGTWSGSTSATVLQDMNFGGAVVSYLCSTEHWSCKWESAQQKLHILLPFGLIILASCCNPESRIGYEKRQL